MNGSRFPSPTPAGADGITSVCARCLEWHVSQILSTYVLDKVLKPRLAEADRHPLWLCPQCLAKLCHATGAEPVGRFQALVEFAKAHDLKQEADFWQKSWEALHDD